MSDADVVKAEIDILIEKCMKLQGSQAQTACIAAHEQRLINEGWSERKAWLVADGAHFILGLKRNRRQFPTSGGLTRRTSNSTPDSGQPDHNAN